jgi:hypothetical protein
MMLLASSGKIICESNKEDREEKKRHIGAIPKGKCDKDIDFPHFTACRLHLRFRPGPDLHPPQDLSLVCPSDTSVQK